jgi:hypothetical protein
MRTGTAYSESLACTIPINDRDLKSFEAEFGVKFHTILQGCMHITVCTRLNILPTCVALAQYQIYTAPIYFTAIQHLIGYLGLHPDLPPLFMIALASPSLSTPWILKPILHNHSSLLIFMAPNAYHTIGSILISSRSLILTILSLLLLPLIETPPSYVSHGNSQLNSMILTSLTLISNLVLIM